MSEQIFNYTNSGKLFCPAFYNSSLKIMFRVNVSQNTHVTLNHLQYICIQETKMKVQVDLSVDYIAV